MNIFCINITCDTTDDDPFFNALAINKLPIIVFDEPDVDVFVKTNREFQDNIKTYIKNEQMFLTAFLNIRIIDTEDDYAVTDRFIKVRDFMTCEQFVEPSGQ